MKILINDLMQTATGINDNSIITPALADFSAVTSWSPVLDESVSINCIGVGYTDASTFTISNGTDTRTVYITQEQPFLNGLYVFKELLPGGEYSNSFTISHNGTYCGRVAIGTYRTIGTSPTKEIGFYDTSSNRVTLSGQMIPGGGGYFGRTVDLDSRYKIDETIYNDIYSAYNYIMREYPYFILLDDEAHKLPASMLRFYGSTDKPITKLQSSTYKFLYSYKFKFLEKF